MENFFLFEMLSLESISFPLELWIWNATDAILHLFQFDSFE